MELNVSEIVVDPQFAQTFIVSRSSGSFVKGRYVDAKSTLKFTGTIGPANPKDILQLPEADRITGAIHAYTVQQLYTTRVNGGTSGISDIIVWRGENYKINSCVPWGDFGYFKTIAVRMVGE